MITNKELALQKLQSLIDENSFTGWTQDAIDGYLTAMKTTKDLIDLASTSNWYYPNKGEFPKDRTDVIALFKVVDNNNNTIYYNIKIQYPGIIQNEYWIENIKAWSPLPKFNNNLK